MCIFANIFGSDPYWISHNEPVVDFVGSVSSEVVRLCTKHDKEPQIWIQGYRVPAEREEEISTTIKVAFDSGVRNIATWCFDGGACMTYISSERPEKVWDTVSKEYKNLQQK